MNGNWEAFIILIEAGADVYAKDSSGTTVWHEAAQHGRYEFMKKLFDSGLVKDWSCDNNGRNMLHCAAREGKSDIAGLIIDFFEKQSADNKCEFIQTKDIDGATPLHLACVQGHPQVVRILLESGANPASKCNAGKTGLEYATHWKRDNCVKLFYI
mmetsp:Transcript_32249/g.51405  ORF Transcript_32249/g.51405 Transcript_32249/m.51405 type:complete len:156 (-) Transcript_32249:11-478(-)